MPYEYLDHPADLGVRGIGSSLEQAFAEGALAMLSVMADPASVVPRQRLVQHCTAPDIPALFVEWLNELLYQQQARGMLFASVRVVRLAQTGREWVLEGEADGEELDPRRHKLHTEVKAATYSGLDYRVQGDRHIIQCIVDL